MKNHIKSFYILSFLLLTKTLHAGSPPIPIQGSCSPFSSVGLYTLNSTFDDMDWNDGNSYTIDKVVVIPAGETLKVRAGTRLEFLEHAGIIVSNGAYLEIKGQQTILTSCDQTKFWKGIKVSGNPSASQMTGNQGKVYIYRSTISRARDALVHYNVGGGIIQAEEANFINNRRSAGFIAYPNYQSLSFFKRCKFEINEDFAVLNYTQSMGACLEAKIGSQLTLWAIQGVRILGCDFVNNYNANQNNSPILSDEEVLGSAIWAEDASFAIEPVNNAFEFPCDYPDGKRNHFEGWHYGIYLKNSNYKDKVVKFVGADFVNNKYGIYIEKAEFITVLNCTFKVNEDLKKVMSFVGCNGNSADALLYGLYVKMRTNNIRLFSNEFELDVVSNYGQYTGFTYVSGGVNIPSNFEIKGNSFKASVDQLQAGFPDAIVTGINVSNYTGNGTIKMRCNYFDLFSGMGSGVNRFILRDVDLTSQSGILTFLPNSASPGNSWSPYSSCFSNPGIFQITRHIMYSDSIVYAHDGVFDNPICSYNYAYFDTVAVQDCRTWDYCDIFGLLPRKKSIIDEDISNAVKSLSIYPNPAKSSINIIVEENKVVLNIRDVQGRVVMGNIEFNKGIRSLDISELPKGLYFIEQLSASKRKMQKIIKE